MDHHSLPGNHQRSEVVSPNVSPLVNLATQAATVVYVASSKRVSFQAAG